MFHRTAFCLVVASLVIASLAVTAPCLAQKGPAKGTTYTDPDKADADFAYQGEYSGTITKGDKVLKRGVQVIALGQGKFHAVGYTGGLPGDGWDGGMKIEADGELKDGKVDFVAGYTASTKDGVMNIVDENGTELGKFFKVERKSPTLGEKPPEGAVVLFDGTSADHFPGAKMSDDGLLMAGATSKQKFGACKVHVEFLLPYQPDARGQGRGNSGLYLQGRYEVQMLDSFGLEGLDNECGGVYKIAKPEVNMCFPPLAWQTYDVDFSATEYDGAKKIKNATMTVLHNGVAIHKDLELPNATTSAPVKDGPEPGPIYLQNHGNPVRYRNIWVVEKK